jgi:hypothetical protein
MGRRRGDGMRPVTIPAVPPVLDRSIIVAPLPAFLERAKNITQK